MNKTQMTDASFGVVHFFMNLPLLLLHMWNVRRHPRMAIAGGLSTLASLGTLALCQPSPSFLVVIHKLSLLEFVYTFHSIVVDGIGRFWAIRFLIGTSVVVWYPATALLPDIFLTIYAVYIAFQLSSVPVVLSYLFSLVMFSNVASLHAFSYVCEFLLDALVYEYVEVDFFIREAKRVAA